MIIRNRGFRIDTPPVLNRFILTTHTGVSPLQLYRKGRLGSFNHMENEERHRSRRIFPAGVRQIDATRNRAERNG